MRLDATLDDLIKYLKKVKSEHGGKMLLYGVLPSGNESRQAWKRLSFFVAVKEPDRSKNFKRVVIG